jgi:hypothetical protein|tara:strand:+ start:20330 stop:20434 length:105 start_codon:yes stop_codon:yes gene_type:complete
MEEPILNQALIPNRLKKSNSKRQKLGKKMLEMIM